MANDTDREQLLAVIDDTSKRWQHGDPGGMLEFWADRDDVTLFGALGGCAVGRHQVTTITRSASAALGKGGNPRYEILAMQVEGDLAYMAGVERVDRAAEGIVALRITNIFRRIDGRWRLIHRHADALKESPFAQG
jgi:ketosteroid isomerase-like protein